MLSRLLVLLMILGGAMLATPAWAGKAVGLDAIVKPDPPGTWHKVTWNTASAPCIGNPITPVCAIETELRCFIVEDRELCNKVKFNVYSEKDIFLHPRLIKWRVFKYRILRVRFLKDSDISAEETLKMGRYSGKPGDIEIMVDRRECDTDLSPACPRRHHGQPFSVYTIRKIDAVWKIVNYSYPRDFKGSVDYRK